MMMIGSHNWCMYLFIVFIQVEMEDTSADIMEEKPADSNGADSADKDDDDDIEPPVMSSNPVSIWTEMCIC